MADEWKHVQLGEVVEIKHGWPFESELFSEKLTGRPIVVNIGNFRYTGGFRFESTRLREYRGNYPKEYEPDANFRAPKEGDCQNLAEIKQIMAQRLYQKLKVRNAAQLMCMCGFGIDLRA